MNGMCREGLSGVRDQEFLIDGSRSQDTGQSIVKIRTCLRATCSEKVHSEADVKFSA